MFNQAIYIMMRSKATTLLTLFALLVPFFGASAQEQVTVRQINTLSPDSIAVLNAQGPNLTSARITGLVTTPLVGKNVTFTAVVVTDPYDSGLASFSNNRVGRIHVYVRDTTAASQGPAGMGIQIVDAAYDQTGLIGLIPGDVITVTGRPAVFNTQIQFTVEAIVPVGDLESFGLPETLMAPVGTITTSEINEPLEGYPNFVAPNWDRFGELRGNYYEIKNARVVFRTLAAAGRPNWAVTTDGGATYVPVYDVSIRYRNDHQTYPDTFNKHPNNEPFVPPPVGSIVNLKGFVIFNGFDPVGNSQPSGRLLSIAPMSDMDLVILETPPVISSVSVPTIVPNSTDPVLVTAAVAADPTRTLQSVELMYFSTSQSDTMTISPTGSNEEGYTFDVPAAADGDFVTYWIRATDNTDAESISDPRRYRVLNGGIQDIADIQMTYDGKMGDSPFTGITTAMDITATVQSNVNQSGFLIVQDDPELGPWSGIEIIPPTTMAFNPGDVIRITKGTVREQFGVTQIIDPEVESVSTGGTTLGYKNVTTGILDDFAVAEAHENMMLRFDNVQVTNIDTYGEWRFATEDPDGKLQKPARGDEASAAIPNDVNQSLEVGKTYDFFRGIWTYSFNTWRLVPELLADLSGVVVANEQSEAPEAYVLHQNYPNPFGTSTAIEFEVAHAGNVSLEVYDMLGRRVAVLIEGVMAPGTHDVSFDASDLSSGMYLYRLSVADQVLTRKMLVVK